MLNLDNTEQRSHYEYRGSELSELKGIIYKTVRVRRITLGSFFIIALFLRLVSGISFSPSLIFSPLVWYLTTFPFKYLIKKQKERATLHKVHAAFFSVEILIITYLIHLMGGVEWIGVVFYMFTIVYANFFLPKTEGYLITGVAIFLYCLLVGLEYLQIIPHRALFGPASRGYQGLFYTLTTVVAGAVGIYSILAITIRIFADIFTKKTQALKQREQELERLSSKLFSTAEEERRRISRKLHDEVGQDLTAIKVNLSLLERAMDKEKLAEAQSLIDGVLKKIRDLSHTLRPSILDNLGLPAALNWLINRFEETTGIQTNLSTKIESAIPASMEILIYRLVQESLSNVRKHAQAESAEVKICEDDKSVKLAISDDGKGFNWQEVLKNPGLGLSSMKEQVKACGGDFEVRSKKGEGTEIKIAIPKGFREE